MKYSLKIFENLSIHITYLGLLSEFFVLTIFNQFVEFRYLQTLTLPYSGNA